MKQFLVLLIFYILVIPSTIFAATFVWDTTQGATGYKLDQSDNLGYLWTTRADVTTNNATIANIEDVQFLRLVAITAYNNIADFKVRHTGVWLDKSLCGETTVYSLSVNNFSKDNSIEFTWNEDTDNATTGYHIYQSNNLGSSWSLLSTVASNSTSVSIDGNSTADISLFRITPFTSQGDKSSCSQTGAFWMKYRQGRTAKFTFGNGNMHITTGSGSAKFSFK